MRYLTRNTTLTAYASDASIYALKPRAVLQILSEQDAMTAISEANRGAISITARGGGTGLAGGAVGDGIILDFSRYNRILEIDFAGLLARAQAGIIYDELNLALKKYNLFFPPDPSSGDSCQIGGMIANNSSGPRSVKYGLTSDFIEELRTVNASGKIITLKKFVLESNELLSFLGENPEYRTIYQLLKDNAALIKERWPKLKKNSAGYNLFQVVSDLNRGIFNLPALMAGSEGTLALILDANLRLLPIVDKRLTIRIYFKSLIAAGGAVPDILALEPSGLEVVDGSTLDLIGRQKFDIPADASALLLVEFDENIENGREAFKSLAAGLDLAAPVEYADDPSLAVPLWRARKAIVPTLYRHHPLRRPIPLVEDISIPPGKIPGFIEYVTDLFKRHNLTYGIFGHIGDGNLHVRPLFDMNNRKDFELAQDIYHRVYDEVISIGGSTTAEHADGRLRAGLLKKMYGEEIYALFGKIKKALDPKGIFSPDLEPGTPAFTEHIDYEKLKSYCAACGKCNGYCPAYDIFRREDFSPRGWLRILNQSGQSRKDLKKHLLFCLNCKNCTDVCPAGVDIAGEIIKFRCEKPSLISKMIASAVDNESILDLSLKLGDMVHPLLGTISNLPKAASETLRRRFSNRINHDGEVAFFHGCADNLLDSSVGEAVFKVFDKLGINISMPEQKCCGLPYEVYGLKDKLFDKAKYNILRLKNFRAVVTGCASCLLRLKDYEKLFEGDPEYGPMAAELANKCVDISQYLNSLKFDNMVFDTGTVTRVTYHNPCHLRAAGLHKEPMKLMSKIKGIEIVHPEYADCCCGQAGSYGYIHPHESKEMFRKKKETYRETRAEYIMTSCPACQMKIRAEVGDEFKVVHPVEILAARLNMK